MAVRQRSAVPPSQQDSLQKYGDTQQGPFSAAIQEMPKGIFAFVQLGFYFFLLQICSTGDLVDHCIQFIIALSLALYS